MNRFREAQIEGKSKKKSGEATDTELKDKLYLLDNGKPYIPGIYFFRCLIDAGKRLQVRGKGKSTYSKIVGSTVTIEPDCIEITGKYREYRVSAVNPMTKGRMMVSRPCFDKWKASFFVLTSDDSIGFETMNSLLTDAGRFTGVGDWRPEKKGSFGKFVVTKFVKEE
jgi:hypothetical protein